MDERLKFIADRRTPASIAGEGDVKRIVAFPQGHARTVCKSAAKPLALRDSFLSWFEKFAFIFNSPP
jgi:hypothetical protein